jgi:peptidoglycan/LPS O-acetylase OafA/YrhL
MNASIPHRTLVCGVAFAFGASSILLGYWLESLAEGRDLSSFPFKSGVVERSTWIAPCIMLTGLALLSVFEVLVCRKSSSGKWLLLRCWVVGLAAFVVGLIAGGFFIPVR